MRLAVACLLALNLVGLSFVSLPTFAAEKIAKLLPAEMAAEKPAPAPAVSSAYGKNHVCGLPRRRWQ
jgi:hypothetical protein